jgi:hypothetical protein
LIAALGAALCGALLFQGLTGAFEDTRHIWVLMGMMAAACDMEQGRKRSVPSA